MTTDELDDVRKIVVAFEDAATWCEELAERVKELILSIQQNRHLSADQLSEQGNEIAETLRHLAADRRELEIIRRRVGIPSLGL